MDNDSNILPPQLSAALAKDAYELVSEHQSLADSLAMLQMEHRSFLKIDEKSLLVASTGLGFLKARTVFGLAAFGKNYYSNHAFIVLRGTEFIGDMLTDANIGVSLSSTHKWVHDGFNETFQSLKHDLDIFITELRQRNIGNVHCIGHSLGGAVVSLVAEYVQASTSLRPYVYTFGAPRVGLAPFANHLTREVTPQKLFRFYHRTDIVPCMPFWPFVHAPSGRPDAYHYFLPSTGIAPWGEWHRIARYADSLDGKSWGQLRSLREAKISDREVERWLEIEAPIHFDITNIRWLDRAIAYVVTKCAKATGIVLNTGFSSHFTLMDKLSYILSRGIDLSVGISSLVMRLIHKIMRFLGLRRVVQKSEATQQFVRTLFNDMAQKMNVRVKAAINHALFNGQAS